MSLSAFLSLLLFVHFSACELWNKLIPLLKLQMDESAGIEAEYHLKNNRVSFGSLNVHSDPHSYMYPFTLNNVCKHT